MKLEDQFGARLWKTKVGRLKWEYISEKAACEKAASEKAAS